MAGPFMYDDGGSNTAPYDTMAKAAPALATIIAIPLAVSERIYIGNDTAGENYAADTTITFPGTTAAPNIIASVDRTNPTVLLAGAILSTQTNKILAIVGGVYFNGITFNIGSGANIPTLRLGVGSTAKQVYDNCTIYLAGTGSTGIVLMGGSSYVMTVVLKNSTIKFSHTGQGFSLFSECYIDNLTIDGAGSAVTGFIKSLGTGRTAIIQNCNLSSAAQGVVLLPATASITSKVVIRNCKLPASWNGTLTAGDAITSIHYRAEMYNCDSADTNYRIIIVDFFAKLVQETTLVATGGATDGTTPISWKVVTTANANQVSPFECPEFSAWNDTEGTQRTCSVKFISTVLLKDNEAWLAANYSTDTADPLYAMLSDRVSDLVFTAAANQTADTTSWSDLVTARANNTAYTLGNLIKCASNAGRVFICTTAGTSDASEPAGYSSAVDGGTVADGGTCVFTAMYRQIASVTLPASKPANKGEILGVFKVGKASATVYVDPFMSVV
jgi:hypothetical protein